MRKYLPVPLATRAQPLARTAKIPEIRSIHVLVSRLLRLRHRLGCSSSTHSVLLRAGRVHAFGPPGEALGVEQLRSAYGGRMLVLDDQGLAVADDHCHDHDHGHGAC